MKTSEIIDGLEDLIQDRKSFVTPANDKFYGKDNPFKYDIAVLKAAIDKLNRRPAPENKPLTLEQLREMDGEPVWIALLNIAKQPTCEVITKICEDGIHTVGAGGSDYASFGLYDKTWLAYASKPEGSEKP